MITKILKKVIVFIGVLCILFITACKKEVTLENVSKEAPNTSKMQSEYNLDFSIMHNFVIDSISQQYTPFFYIKNGEFDISGDNSKKVIIISCKCVDGTTVEDLDLFLSLVLNYASFNAAEQDFRFAPPTIDKTGTYTDFGTVFNTYDLVIDAENESGETIRNNYIKAKENIPIEPRYWSE